VMLISNLNVTKAINNDSFSDCILNGFLQRATMNYTFVMS